MRWIISLVGGVAAAVTGIAIGAHFRPDAGSFVGQSHASGLDTVVAGRRFHADEAPLLALASDAGAYTTPLAEEDIPPPPPPPPPEDAEPEPVVAQIERASSAPKPEVEPATTPAADDWAQDVHQGAQHASSDAVAIPERTPYY